jgi:hypothetical protein
MSDLAPVFERLDRIEDALKALLDRRPANEWYTTEQLAKILGRAEFTVREWARLGRINAAKKGSGRGRYQSWAVSHGELLRIQREGLLPRARPG